VKIKLPLTLRLLLFNVLVLFLPVATLLYLDTYETQLLSMQESAMVQQGRILSAALQDRPLEDSQSIIDNLEQRSAARIRILDQNGRLIADSARLVPLSPEETDSPEEYRRDQRNNQTEENRVFAEEDILVRDSLLYQVFSRVYKLYRRYFQPPDEIGSGNYYSGKEVLLGEEVKAALEGRYGAMTRVSTGDQRSINLYSALPVFLGKQVSGVVLVSQSTYRILSDLYKLRLDIIRIFSLSLLISLVISLLLSLQITRPIVRLSRQAEKVLDPHGQFTGHFPVFRRRDELGDLSRSLQLLSQRLETKIQFIDSMTADMVHELKNPLSSISSSMELLTQDKENPLINSMQAQIKRMDGLLNRLRELTSIEQKIDHEDREILILEDFLPLFLSLHVPWAEDRLQVEYIGKGNFPLNIRGDRLSQLLINLLDNALSFSPDDETISLIINRNDRSISVIDRGPGVPEGNRDKLFHRFFSDRPERGNHSGLGLAIVWAIMKGYGGKVVYKDNPEGGAWFQFYFPKQ